MTEREVTTRSEVTSGDPTQVSMRGWFGVIIVCALAVMIGVSVWSLIVLPSGTCVTMQWGLDGSPGWCASKPLAAFALPSLAVVYGLRLYLSFEADENSPAALVSRLVGPAVLLGVHIFLLVSAA